MTKKKFNPWPMGLFLSLALFITVQLSVVGLAASTFEGLDDVEYYRHGIEYGQEIQRQKMQKDLGWQIEFNLKEGIPTRREYPLRVRLQDRDGKPVVGAKAHLKMGRPATIRDDQQFDLKEVGPGIHEVAIVPGPGAWRFDLTVEKGETVVKATKRHRF
ncbi:MAG: FixH family protein [Vulcanimicrobiota bacterium]